MDPPPPSGDLAAWGLPRSTPGHPETLMKLLPLLLLQLATVGVALLVYDQLRHDPPPSTPAVESDGIDAPALERRLQALEASRRPSLTATGTDPRLLERLEALEAAIETPPGTAGQGTETPERTGRAPAEDALPSPTAFADEPSARDVQGFRKLQAAAKQQERLERNRKRVDGALDKLSLRLSKNQRAKIHTAFSTFQPRVAQIWSEVKTEAQKTIAAGGDINRGELVASTTARIQQEFATSLDGIVSSADAETVAATLMPDKR